jgi:hypothetical protein
MRYDREKIVKRVDKIRPEKADRSRSGYVKQRDMSRKASRRRKLSS